MKTLQAQYRENRARFTIAELEKHNGHWVAFSADGCRIVASSDDISGVADQLKAVGEQFENVWLERIELETGDTFIGGAEIELVYPFSE